MIISY